PRFRLIRVKTSGLAQFSHRGLYRALLLQGQPVHEPRIRVVGSERDGPLECRQCAIQVPGVLQRHSEISKRSVKSRIELGRLLEYIDCCAGFALSLQSESHCVERRGEPGLKVDGRLEFRNRSIDLLLLEKRESAAEMPVRSARPTLPILGCLLREGLRDLSVSAVSLLQPLATFFAVARLTQKDCSKKNQPGVPAHRITAPTSEFCVAKTPANRSSLHTTPIKTQTQA